MEESVRTRLVDWSQAASVPTKIRESAVTTSTFSNGVGAKSAIAGRGNCLRRMGRRTVQVSSEGRHVCRVQTLTQCAGREK